MVKKAPKARGGKLGGARSRALKRLDGDFWERLFTPKPSSSEIVWVVAMSLGGLALGAGAYAQWLGQAQRASTQAAPWLVGVGALLVAGYAFFGRKASASLRVGDLGITVDDGDSRSRTYWHEFKELTLTHGTLRLTTSGRPITIALADHRAAAQLVLSEANARLPERVKLNDAEQKELGDPADAAGERLVAEPPQVTMLHCHASDKALTIEKDARLCSQCSAPYHRSAVPAVCLECGKKLKKSGS